MHRKRILDGVSGQVFPGEMVAVLGASGSGKTTLLNALSRRNTKATGTVLLNGVPADRSIRSVAAYVQQEDLMMGALTVREHLLYHARLRLPPGTSAARLASAVDELMSRLGLTKCAFNRIGSVATGEGRGISGGERKRLAFATELLGNPPLVFADEPTSGLDSFMAASVVRTMRALADAGRCVLATIHAPSSDVFSLFDRIILLCEGRVAFAGTRDGALAWFAARGRECPLRYNPADFFISLLALRPEEEEEEDGGGARAHNDSVRTLVDQWSASQECAADASRPLQPVGAAAVATAITAFSGGGSGGFGGGRKGGHVSASRSASEKTALLIDAAAAVAATSAPEGADVATSSAAAQMAGLVAAVPPLHEIRRDMLSWPLETAVLMHRSFVCVSRDSILVGARAMQTVALAAIASAVYWRLGGDQKSVQNKSGALFFLLINQALAGLVGVLQTFPVERPVFQREYEGGLYRASSYFVARNAADVPWQLLFPVVFCTVCFWAMGLHDGVSQWALFTAVLVLVANTAASMGYFISSLSRTVAVALALAPLFLLPFILFAGFLLNLDDIAPYFLPFAWTSPFRFGFSALMGIVWTDVTLTCPPPQLCVFHSGDDVLRNFSIYPPDLPRDVAALAGLLAAWRIAAFAVLWLRARRKQNE